MDNCQLSKKPTRFSTSPSMDWFPNVSLAGVVFTVFFAILTLAPNAADSDYFWHLKTGEYIIRNWTIPHSDIFSYTRYGHHWVAHEWLSEVILYLIHKNLGEWGIRAFVAFAFALSFKICYAIANKLSRNPASSLYVTIMFMVPAIGSASARPQLFTFIFFSSFLYILFEYIYFKHSRHLKYLPFIMVFWVNLHAGYMIGLVLLGLTLIARGLDSYLERKPDHLLKTLALWTLATILSTIFTPNFPDNWIYPFVTHSMQVTNYIQEWLSPNFHKPIYQYYLLLIVSFISLLISATKKPSFFEAVVPAFFIIISLISLRHTILACLGLIPFTGLALTNASHRFRSFLLRYEKKSGQMSKREPFLHLLLCLLAIAASILLFPNSERKMAILNHQSYPEDAVKFINSNEIQGRVFNTYNIGGYLIYKLYPHQLVFIDGRSDMYGDLLFMDYQKLYSAASNWKQLLAKYKIDYIICDKNSPLRQVLLENDHFMRVFDDGKFSIFLENKSRFEAIIKKYQIDKKRSEI